MKSFIKALKSFAAAKDGATAIEYALLAALIGSAIIVAAGLVGTNVAGELTSLAGNLNQP
jgi:pilus assembly protein Flp/PilA